MSVNDLLDADLTPAILIVFFVMIIVIPVGIIIGKSSNDKIFGNTAENQYQETKTALAKLIAKQTQPHPLSQGAVFYTAIFELEDGSRLNFAIQKPVILNTLVEGDVGTLCYQGKKFIDFVRDKDFEN